MRRGLLRALLGGCLFAGTSCTDGGLVWLTIVPAVPDAAPSLRRSLAAGYLHTCVVGAGGTVACWGANGSGQLGDGTTSDSFRPVVVPGLTGVTSLAAGLDSTCAVRADETVVCWGDNGAGALGDPNTVVRSPTPVAIPDLAGVTAVAVGGDSFACALLAGGTVDCWGAGFEGELADGGAGAPLGTPVEVPGLAGVVAIAAGLDQACALLGSGAVACWGGNYYGQLGNGGAVDSAEPVAVLGITNAVAIAAGTGESCALLADGTAECWGDGQHGKLGNDGGVPALGTPVPVSGLTGAKTIAASGNHACALVSDGGAVCWGENNNGQLGTLGFAEELAPEPVFGLKGAVAIATGEQHTCAVLGDDSVACWGASGAPAIANGTTTSLPVTGVTGTTDIVAGSASDHTCARLADAGAVCWGGGVHGELGDGTMNTTFDPVAVVGVTGSVSLAAGADHTCAVSPGGDVECWGANDSGQLGTGTASSALSTEPARVSGVTGAIAVGAGFQSSCALIADGTVECWGDNTFGQLGDGDTTIVMSATPVAVLGLTGATSLSVGYQHVCAIVAGGGVRCWGDGRSGELGNGSTSAAATFVPVSGLTTVTAVAAGGNHTCALLPDGTVSCWGRNNDGQLGNGTSALLSSTPQPVSGLAGVVALAAGGEDATCALRGDGSVACWGAGAGGELGNWGTANASTPVPVYGLSGATAVAAGNDYFCVRLGDASIACWGNDQFGSIGHGSTVPVKVLGL
jgi:alpha-tubulin suppressor-like RCC1 family protein